MYKSVLVATDGSETASEAVRIAMELAKELGATLHVVSVYQSGTKGALRVTEMTGVYPGVVDTLSIADTLLEGIASLARTKGVETHTYAVTGTVADRIVAVAEEQQVDLIVVGNKGMKGAKRILGSVPNAVAHAAPCAVLIHNTT
jgi:nucleotide-binding universal stress UspA family protein